ncbi:MAG: patatin-like phospholipase family protein [Bacteroidales bacterium]
MAKKYKTGLVLSGGAARGLAHLGVIKALYEKDIKPDVISGTSAGSIAGAFLADGYDPEELLEIFMEKKIYEFLSLSFGKMGLLKIQGIKEVLQKNLKAKKFEDLNIPLYVAVTNMNSGETEYFNEGDLIDIVIASSSIPVLFIPSTMNGSVYADGGILDNLPVRPIRDKCEKVIGVNVNYTGPEDKINSMMKIAERSFHLSIGARITELAKECDLFIEPEELKKYGLLDVGEGRKMFEIGYKKAKKMLEESDVFK